MGKSIFPGRIFTVCLALVFVLLFLLEPAVSLFAQELAPPNDITRAEHFLLKFENRVERMRGQPFSLGYDDNEALRRVRALKEAYPDDPQVEELFQRARTALMRSQGEYVEITPDMLVYRENEQILKDIFGRVADEEWRDFSEKILDLPGTIVTPFPIPDRQDVAVENLMGKYVILEDFQYPANQFYDLGREFVFVGSRTRGFYYVDISGRSWLGPYEALKRYRRLINRDLAEEGRWTLVGQIEGIELVIPQAEEEKTIPAQWGWVVTPVALYVPETVFAVVDRNHEMGASFAGEERREEIKGPLYTVLEVPLDVTPDRLVEIFAAAIKEKNFDLYADCIDPERRKTPIAMSLLRYHWDLHLDRFARFYVHITVDEPVIEVVKGYAPGADNLEDFFLDDEQKAILEQISEPLVEKATVWSRAWDERGRQYGSPKPHFLVRTDQGRWYISNYAQPF